MDGIEIKPLNAKDAKLFFADASKSKNAKDAKEEYEERNFALFAWIYPAKQGFALFAVNGSLF